MAIGRRGPRRAFPVAAFCVVAAVFLAGADPVATAGSPDLGVGILSVDGSLTTNVTLPSSGSYYLTIAPDTRSFVEATLLYNGSMLAQTNRTSGETTQVSLPAGNYSLALLGHGRAALGWDFTNGSLQEFPDNQTLVAFLAPSGPLIQVSVATGDAESISLQLFDDGLLAAGNATVTVSETVDFSLPALNDSVAFLVASVTGGNPNGRFGLSWNSEPVSGPIDLTAWPWFLLWILVPIGVAAVVFAAIQRRRRWRAGL